MEWCGQWWVPREWRKYNERFQSNGNKMKTIWLHALFWISCKYQLVVHAFWRVECVDLYYYIYLAFENWHLNEFIGLLHGLARNKSSLIDWIHWLFRWIARSRAYCDFECLFSDPQRGWNIPFNVTSAQLPKLTQIIKRCQWFRASVIHTTDVCMTSLLLVPTNGYRKMRSQTLYLSPAFNWT